MPPLRGYGGMEGEVMLGEEGSEEAAVLPTSRIVVLVIALVIFHLIALVSPLS